MTVRSHAVFGIVASVTVIFAIVWGFMLAGSPATRRLQRVDERRLEDLQQISREIQSLVVGYDGKRELKEPLPKTLDEVVEKAQGTKLNPHDPETGEPYGYTVKDETTFELCARFTTRRDSNHQVFWNHPVGPHCFTIKVLDFPRGY